MNKLCSFEGCYRPEHCKALCQSHYAQKRRGMELTPLRRYRRISNGKKECSVCGQVKSLDEFYRLSRQNGTKTLSPCKVCSRRLQAEFKKARRRASQARRDENNNEVGQDPTTNKTEATA